MGEPQVDTSPDRSRCYECVQVWVCYRSGHVDTLYIFLCRCVCVPGGRGIGIEYWMHKEVGRTSKEF